MPHALKVPAILILNKNKTYGRLDGGRLLYRAVPNDATRSPVLVPYTIKPGFSKAYVNMYVLLEPWDANTKHTAIAEVIGAVDILDNTYIYELHCKELWLPTPPAFKRPYIPPVFTADDTATPAPATIFTIDGPTTRDFDDAFSICQSANSEITEIAIYISNVPLILAHMGLLTDLVAGQKMSSIYLPNKVVPMLPTRFSEGLCSLRADGIIKPCFKLLFGINSDGGIVYYSTNTENVIISHNYVYETAELLDSPDYILLAQTTNVVFNCAAFAKNPGFARTFNFMTCPQTSDEIVAYWMLMMNWIMSQNATRHDTGSTYKPIYRADELIMTSGGVAPTTLIQDILDPEIEKAIRRRYTDSDTHFVGEYTTTPRQHHTLDIPTYMHITSPIRRMPDVINIAIHMLREEHILCKLSTPVHQQIIQALDIYQSAHADFVARINTQMCNIKRAQRQCDLLAAAATLLPDETRRQYAAILCCMRHDVEKNEWEIYIPEMRLFTTVIAPFDTDTIHRNVICELYAFYDATTSRRFIRAGLVQPAV